MMIMSGKLKVVGLKFGRLTVLSELPERDRQGKVVVECKCDCGNTVPVRSSMLKSGLTKSCGCLQKEITGERSKIDNRTHGFAKTSTYVTYYMMLNRCNNPKSKPYPHYGGRGIKVCERWMQSFENFLEDMGERPSANLSLERKNNDGDYELSNCKWADRYEQANNKSNNTFISYKNELYTIAELARLLKINRHILRDKTSRKHIFIYE